jgi:hypothetical protein
MRSLLPQQFVRSTIALALALSMAAPVLADNVDKNHPRLRAALAVQREVTAGWMRKAEVLGTAVTLDSVGNSALAVYVDRDAEKAADAVRTLPTQWRGVPVEVRFTDKFRAVRKRRGVKPPPGPSHKSIQAFPIQLGTSGGSINDVTGFSCCAGTLGGLIQIAGQQYVLSNYHVFEGDIVSGRNGSVATTGDLMVQPGLIDMACSPETGRGVATLEVRNSLPDNNVDCAIAQVLPGTVAADGAIQEIGTLSAQTAAAFINQAVKKSGRTTGLTRTSVMGLNATISVTYDTECGGMAAFTKTFTGQIVVRNTKSSFLAGGDSGSLLVEDVATNPRAVGLLFAASSTDAIANPIDEVLTFLGATMVGN